MVDTAKFRVEVREDEPERKADGETQFARALADGSLVVAGWEYANLLNGRLFTANVGTVTSPVTGASGITVTVPDVHVQVPANVKIVPVHIGVNLDAKVDDRDLELVAAISNGRDSSPTGGSGQTILNRAQNHGRGSRCIVESDVTAITTPVTDRDYLEFWRVRAEFGAAPVALNSEEGGQLTYNWDFRKFAPLALVGESELVLYCSGIGGTLDFFATITWVELPA